MQTSRRIRDRTLRFHIGLALVAASLALVHCAGLTELGPKRQRGSGNGGSDSSAGGSAGAGNTGSAHPSNCTSAFVTTPVEQRVSGVYTIDPDGEGGLPTMPAYCDFDEGGGWTLILHYNHVLTSGAEPLVLTTGLPLLDPSAEFPIDEANTPNWGHAAPALVDALTPTELRFYGRTTQHQRVIHFSTTLTNCVAYARTGKGSCAGIQRSFTPLTGHTAFLPGSANANYSDQHERALIQFPFYEASTHHWSVKGVDGNDSNRWEVDNWINGAETDTEHRVWVRSPIEYPTSCAQLAEWNPGAASGDYELAATGSTVITHCELAPDAGPP